MKKIFLGLVLLSLSCFAVFGQTSTQPSSRPEATSVDETSILLDDPQTFTAQTAGENAETNQNLDASFGIWDLVKMILVLAVILAAIYGILYFVKKNKRQNTEESKLMSLLASQGLPGNRWLHLVSVQKQVFLIGSADQSVNLIAEITDPEARSDLQILASEEQSNKKKTFTDLLGETFSRGFSKEGNPVKTASASETEQERLLREQAERLKKL